MNSKFVIEWVNLEINPYLYQKKQIWKTWLSKLACHNNFNVDVHGVNVDVHDDDFEMSPDDF